MTSFDYVRVEITIFNGLNFFVFETYDLYPSLDKTDQIIKSTKRNSKLPMDAQHYTDIFHIEYENFSPTEYPEISIH